MNDEPNRERKEPRRARRTYEKPGFMTSLAFERTSLACGNLNQASGPPFFCNNQS